MKNERCHTPILLFWLPHSHTLEGVHCLPSFPCCPKFLRQNLPWPSAVHILVSPNNPANVNLNNETFDDSMPIVKHAVPEQTVKCVHIPASRYLPEAGQCVFVHSLSFWVCLESLGARVNLLSVWSGWWKMPKSSWLTNWSIGFPVSWTHGGFLLPFGPLLKGC